MRWLPSSLFTGTLVGCLGGGRSSVHPARGSGPPPYLRWLPSSLYTGTRVSCLTGGRSSVQPARGSGHLAMARRCLGRGGSGRM